MCRQYLQFDGKPGGKRRSTADMLANCLHKTKLYWLYDMKFNDEFNSGKGIGGAWLEGGQWFLVWRRGDSLKSLGEIGRGLLPLDYLFIDMIYCNALELDRSVEKSVNRVWRKEDNFVRREEQYNE